MTVPPIRDVERTYTDWKGARGHCRVRIFPGTATSSGLPVVILSELATSHGPSITNTIEQLAAEIASRYLPEMDGLEPPAYFWSTTRTPAVGGTGLPPSTSTW